MSVALSPSTRTPSVNGVASPIWSRLVNVALGLTYLLTFRWVYWSYISVEWGYTGLIFRDLTLLETAFMYVAVAVASWFIPLRFDKPSAVVIWFFYAIVYVPTIAITLMIGVSEPTVYMPALTALTVAMIVICEMTTGDVVATEGGFEPTGGFVQVLVLVFVLASAAIIYTFRDIMSFASIDDVYIQRFIAADMTSGVMGYVRAYYGSLLAPLLIATGAVKLSRWPLVAIGTFGFIISYMVDASKISLVVPIIMLISSHVFRSSRIRLYHFTGVLIVICLISAALTSSARFVRFVADLILLRTISIPAQTFVQYYDVFSTKGYTWWSNVTGLNLILPVPTAFRADQFWPVLGQIVGAEYYGFGSRVNLNANPFVGEGVAAASWFGILVIAVAIAIFLKVLDRFSLRWNRRLVLVAMVPIGLTLTNVHLSTFLVSFGGLAWLALLGLYRPRHPERRGGPTA